MAESQDDRTEQATGRRVSEAIGEGNIPLSRDTAQWCGLVAGVIALSKFGGGLRDALLDLVVTSARGLDDPDLHRLLPFVMSPLRLGFMIGLAVAGAVTGGMLLQTRGRVWPDKVFKGFGGLFSASKLKQIFSTDVFVQLGMSVVKCMTVGWAVWSGMHNEFLALPSLLMAQPGAQFAMLFHPLQASAVKVLAALGVLAGLDFAVTHHRHRKAMKMTKSDVRRERKDDEGDPSIRARRRRKHRDILRGLVKVEVPRADALIVNPTHIAIAIRYRSGEDRAPVVTAKGKGDLAEYMRDLARSHGIPIVEDIPLARLLYRKVKIGRAVPSETYRAVAAILAFVYRVTGRRPQTTSGAGRSRPVPREANP